MILRNTEARLRNFKLLRFLQNYIFNSAFEIYTLYFISYLLNHVYIITASFHFSSWLGLACIVVFLILTVHRYVAPTLNKLIINIIIIIISIKLHFLEIITTFHHIVYLYFLFSFLVLIDY